MRNDKFEQMSARYLSVFQLQKWLNEHFYAVRVSKSLENVISCAEKKCGRIVVSAARKNVCSSIFRVADPWVILSWRKKLIFIVSCARGLPNVAHPINVWPRPVLNAFARKSRLNNLLYVWVLVTDSCVQMNDLQRRWRFSLSPYASNLHWNAMRTAHDAHLWLYSCVKRKCEYWDKKGFLVCINIHR